MLPGFRFLFAAILLSTSVLVFGLGAVSLLRATHQHYVSNPSWRNGPQERVFAQGPEQVSEPAPPVLAALRVEPAAVEPEPSVRDLIPTIALPAETEQVAAVETEVQAQPAPSPAAIPVTEAAKAEPTAEAAALAPADTLTPADTTASVPAETPPAAAPSALDGAATRVAALNEPATTSSKDPKAKPTVKVDSGKPESKATKPRAHRVKKRRRIVRRPPPPVQQLDPFGQPQPTFAATATTAPMATETTRRARR